jgi:4-hydroxy-3-methylbut-2-enyl diphosphate reductase
MKLKVEKAEGAGFCYGVKRALDIVEKSASERGDLETLGAVVHNQQVLQKLAESGVRVVKSIDGIKGNVVVISSHGLSPSLQSEICDRNIEIIDTTCPFVHRAQVAAKRLAESGFFVVIYGEKEHPEVKGLLGWANGKGVATLDEKFISKLDRIPRRLGILSQTTQIPTHFIEFVKRLLDVAYTRDSEIRIIDTICHDIRKRQEAALKLARKVDLMLVVGGRTSANTRHLAELCATVVETHQIETASDIEQSWLQGKHRIGVTSGASTAEQTIDEVVAKLESIN